MSRESTGLQAALVEWLTRADHEPVRGWEGEPALDELRCHPDLIERLSAVARPVTGTARVFVAGCPVVHHPQGRPIAAAAGTGWLVVRSDGPAGALAEPHPPELGSEWIALAPFPADVAFARGIDLLRSHVVRAYELADAQWR